MFGTRKILIAIVITNQLGLVNFYEDLHKNQIYTANHMRCEST